jgi:hypothetical protein
MTDHRDDEDARAAAKAAPAGRDDDDLEGEDDDDYDDYEDEDDGDEDDDEEEEEEPWELLSQALGSLDELGSDEDLALDVSERLEAPNQPERFAKVPLDQAQNLIEVRNLARGVKDGSITMDVYRSRLKLMVRSLEEGLKVVKSEAVVARIEELPEEQKVFFVQTQHLVEALVRGGQHMLKYAESKQISDLEEGHAIIEQAFQELDDMQTRAIEAGREIALREAAMGE